MKNFHLPLKAIGIVVLVMMGIKAEALTRYSAASGNWNATSSWSSNSGGSGGATVPVAGDVVVIERGHDITIDGTVACASVQLGSTVATDRPGTITFNLNSQLTVSGIVSLGRPGLSGSTNTGTINMTAGGTLICASIVSNTTNDVFNEGSGTVMFTGTFSLGTNDVGNQFGSFYNLHINSGTVTYTKNITILSDLSINTGATLDLSTFTSNRSTSGGTLTVAGTLLLGGTTGGVGSSNFPLNFSTHTLTSGTVNYDNTNGNQTIFATPVYNNLTLGNSSGTQTAGGNITVNGTIITTTGGTFNMATHALSAATVIHSAILRTQNTSATPLTSGKTWGGTVEYDASSAQSVASGTYANLTMSGTGGGVAVGDITVNAVLNLSAASPNSTNGTLEMTHLYGNYSNIETPTASLTTTCTQAHDILDSFILYMGPTATTIGQGDVTGKVKRTTIADNTEYTFGNPYTSILFTQGSGSLPTAIMFVITKGPVRGIHANKTNTVERLYQVIKTGGNDLTTFGLKLHYLDSELNGNSEGNIVLWDHHIPYISTNTPHEHGKVSQSSGDNWITLSGHGTDYLSSGEVIGGSTKYWMISSTLTQGNIWLGGNTNWDQNSNWTRGQIPSELDMVIIPKTPNAPTLSATAIAKSIIIESGGILDGGSGTLTIKGGTIINGGVGSWNNYGTFNPGTSTVIFDFPRNSQNETSTISGTANFNNITIATNTFLTLQSGSAMSIAGIFTNSGTLDCATNDNTVEYNGADQLILIPNGVNPGYHNLTLSNSGIKRVPTIVVGNDFTISGSATVTQSSNTLAIGGNFANTSSSGVIFDGIVHFNGILAQTIGGSSTTSFANLKINNSSGVSLSQSETITTTLKIGDVVQNSTLNDNGYQISGPGTTGGNSLSIGSGSTLLLGNSTSATTLPVFETYEISTTGIVNYASDQNQVISTAPTSLKPYGDVILSGTGTKTTVSGTLNIGQNLICNSPVLFNTNNTTINISNNLSGNGNISQGGTISLKGNWTNTGTFTPSSSDVKFINTEPQFIAGAQGLTFRNIQVYSKTTNLTPGNLNIIESLTGTGLWIQGANTQLNISGIAGLAIDAVTSIPNTVAYNGSIEQTIYGTNYYNLLLEIQGMKSFQSTTTSIINDLTINGTVSAQGQVNFTIGGNLNIGSDASFYVSPTSTATVTGEITNARGTGGLIIQSNATRTGSLITTTPNISATVERYIANDFKWHFLSSPVASQNIWPQFAPDPGVGLSWGAYNATTPYNWDFYYYNPNALVASQLYWVNLRKDETGAYNDGSDMAPNSDAGYGAAPPTFVTGRGYLVAYNTSWTTGSPTTHTFTGVLNSGNVVVPLYYNSGNTYNLTGNPYPSSIDWTSNSWTRNALATANGDGYDCWIWNDNLSTGNYGVCNSISGAGTNNVSKDIAPGQAFFVKAASSGSLGMSDAIRVHSSQPFLKNTNSETNLIRLKIESTANTYSDEMIVEFNSEFSGGGSDKFWSFYTEAPELYSVKEGNNYSINRYNALADDMKVNIAAKTGVAATYTITATNIADFTLRDKVYLLDLKTGIKTNLKQTPSYSFSGAVDDDRKRFQLIFGTSIGVHEETSSDITIYASENVIYIRNNKASEPYTVMVSNMLGQIISRSILTGNTLNQIELNRAPGVYVVTVYSEGSLFSRKVVLN